MSRALREENKINILEKILKKKKKTLVLIICSILVTKVKNDTGVAITIPPDTANSNIIRIEGEPGGVQRAKEELMKLANKIVSVK